jgi:formate hydrogenlyase transcriptional activator
VAHAVGNESGKVEYVGSVMDITERKLAEAALRSREHELRQLADVVPHNIFVFSREGSPLYANEVLLNYFGCTLEDVQAKDFRRKIYHPDDFDRVQSIREDAISRGVAWEAEARLRRKDGQYRWFLLRVNPLRDEGGRVIRWYSTGTDIEDRKQTEDALRRAQDELQRERDRLRLLLELTNQVVSNLEPRDLLRTVTASIRRVVQCEAVTIRLPNQDNTRLAAFALDFPESKGLLTEETLIPVEGTLCGEVFRTGKPVVSDDLGVDAPASAGQVEGLKSGCFLPLSFSNRVLGVMWLGRRDGSFTPDEVGFLTQVAGQVAIAVHNAIAYVDIGNLKDKLAQEKVYLEDEIRSEMNFEEIIGKSAALHNVLKQVETVARTESTVLIHGETGTGKELVARALHNLSPRRSNSFVKLNCAAIPTGLLESELFGHEKGAFTGAIAQRIGRFELAHRGTVFLDEIGEIPLELQPKLLRVLQEREFERLGSTRTLRSDARLIAATNRDLAAMVEEQKFRSDLFYRLNVFPVRLPPLRERPEDIPLLVSYFAQQFASRMKKRIESISSKTMSALCGYHWPGNIRELQNVIERAVILSSEPELRVQVSDFQTNGSSSDSEIPSRSKMQSILEETERKQILAALEEARWVVAGPKGAAARLGMKRSTLQARMQKLGIARNSRPN